jgi:hypothetical protein
MKLITETPTPLNRGKPMREQRTVLLAAGVVIAVILAGCTTKTQPQTGSAPQKEAPKSATANGESSTSAVKEQRVTLYVEGMTKVLGIT